MKLLLFINSTEDVSKNRQAIANSIFEYLIEVKKDAENDFLNPDEPVKIQAKSIAEMRQKLGIPRGGRA